MGNVRSKSKTVRKSVSKSVSDVKPQTVSPTSEEVRFTFLHDLEDGRRHATIARKLLPGNRVAVDFAINRVEDRSNRTIGFNSLLAYANAHSSEVENKIDYFSKPIGRKIAESRLNNQKVQSFVTSIREDETPLTASIRLLTEVDSGYPNALVVDQRTVPHVLRQMARTWLKTRQGK